MRLLKHDSTFNSSTSESQQEQRGAAERSSILALGELDSELRLTQNASVL